MKKVSILTGFLGAGKTTFLNQYIQQFPQKKLAIIENEYGEESIDDALIFKTEEDILTLNNGCLCCTLNDNLYEILFELYKRSEEYDEIIIEATGIADPAGIAEPFLIHPTVKSAFHLKNVICLIDAEQFEDQLQATTEAIKQLAFSNIVLINKADLVHAKYLDELSQKLANLNPLAKVLHRNAEKYLDFEDIENGDFMENHSSLLPIKEEKKENEKTHHHHHHQHSDILSLTLRFEQAFDIERLQLLLMQYLAFQAKDMYRIKGVVFNKKREAYLVQSVGKRLSITPLAAQSDRFEKSTFVFIGKNLVQAAYQKLLEKAIER